jgi:hypothetical protein
MCFSAGASFGASALLLGVGIGAIKKAESPKMMDLHHGMNPRYIFFCSLPR